MLVENMLVEKVWDFLCNGCWTGLDSRILALAFSERSEHG
jgi:hypothetical protein